MKKQLLFKIAILILALGVAVLASFYYYDKYNNYQILQLKVFVILYSIFTTFMLVLALHYNSIIFHSLGGGANKFLSYLFLAIFLSVEILILYVFGNNFLLYYKYLL